MRKREHLSVSVPDIQQNEFLQGNFQGMNRAFSRDLRIKKLEERNVKLQEEVIKIQRVLSGIGTKIQYGVRLPEIKTDVIRNQIENAYKKVKQYQYEINKTKRLDVQGAFFQQVNKLQSVLKQKHSLAGKLRKQIGQVKKQSVEYVRMLKNDCLKQQQIQKEKTLNADIKWTNEKLKHFESKQTNISNNLEKLKQQIQKMEKNLTSLNKYDKTEIENIKSKIFNSNIHNFTTNNRESDQQLQPPEARDDIFLRNHTTETHHLFLNEVKLYRKLQKDYQGKIELLTKQKQLAEDRNFDSRNKLIQVQYNIQEIDKVQTRIKELKCQLDPRALIPTKMDMILQEKRRYSSSIKINKPKITMAHLYKYSEVGQATKNGKRFIDRSLIGKRPVKVVGINFYQKKDGQHELLGIQAIYLIKNTKKEGQKNLLADPNTVQLKNSLLQQGDFIKSIDCFLDDIGIVIGVSMVSARNVLLKGGATSHNRRMIQMQPEEYPVCFYGCLLINGIQMLGVELIKDQ